MARTLYLVSASEHSGLTTVALGLFHALDRAGIPVGFVKPIAQMYSGDTGPERSTHIVRMISSLRPPTPMSLSHAEQLLSEGKEDQLLEEVVDRYERAAKDVSLVIVEGLAFTQEQPYSTRINIRVARALDAEILLVASPGGRSRRKHDLEEILEIAARPYGGVGHERVLGCILNLVDAPRDMQGRMRFDVGSDEDSEVPHPPTDFSQLPLFQSQRLKLLGSIPWDRDLITPRVRDVIDFSHTEIVHEGQLDRRVTHAVLGIGSLAELCNKLRPGCLLLTSGDRSDALMAAAMAGLNGVHIAGMLLTNGLEPPPQVMEMCRAGLNTGMPVLKVSNDMLETVLNIPRINLEVPLDDYDRIDRVVKSVATHVDISPIEQLLTRPEERRLSPPAFRHRLVDLAHKANKRIVLPEGDEPRTIQAAAICQQRGIARCVLLGKAARIHAVAAQQGVSLPPTVEIIDPDTLIHDYVAPMVALRKDKGMIPEQAEEMLQDPVVLGTMMLAEGHVDGLVSGAVHTTANTIRPALQLIKTTANARLVSSIFFMCLPDQVLVYGDCAVNPNPDSESLADIAIQSAESAEAFGITPRVAMLSYSTGASGSGSDVEKVREATRIARERRPDLAIDGPLQYDAAAIKAVGESKAPGSEVAGRATVFIFPDLNTGNTTYKAVQRSADVISIGPMLQGMRKPVNDLSRGAMVEDIVFTIALTAIQAVQAEEREQQAVEAIS